MRTPGVPTREHASAAAITGLVLCLIAAIAGILLYRTRDHLDVALLGFIPLALIIIFGAFVYIRLLIDHRRGRSRVAAGEAQGDSDFYLLLDARRHHYKYSGAEKHTIIEWARINPTYQPLIHDWLTGDEDPLLLLNAITARLSPTELRDHLDAPHGSEHRLDPDTVAVLAALHQKP